LTSSYTKDEILLVLAYPPSVSYLREEHPELWDKYNVISGPLGVVKMLGIKDQCYDFFKKCGLSSKRYTLLSDYKSGDLSFPVILKRNVERRDLESRYKCVKLNTEQELLDFTQTVPAEIRNYLILQECIDDDFVDLDWRGYVHGGDVKGCALIQELRTYPEGIPTYLEEISDSEIYESVTKRISDVLKSLNYTGFIGIDIKYRKSDKEMYILDVNPRIPASVSSWLYKYKETDLIEFFKHIENPPMLNAVRTIRWVNVARDIQARVKKRDYSNLIKSLTAKKDVWSWNDPIPFILNVAVTVARFFTHKL
jgi:predicted ATP-grasp superfamily ATP-dependent carboligase